MSEQPNPYQNFPQMRHIPMPLPEPKKPNLFQRFGLPVGLLAAGLIFGGAVGASAVPEPVVQEKIVTKEVTVTEYKTPAECRTALEHAGTINNLSAEAMGYMGEALEAAGNIDADGIDAANKNLDTVIPKLDTVGPKFRDARDTCIAG